MTYLEFEKPIAELIEQKEKIEQAAAKSGVYIALLQTGGNATLNPTIGHIHMDLL